MQGFAQEVVWASLFVHYYFNRQSNPASFIESIMSATMLLFIFSLGYRNATLALPPFESSFNHEEASIMVSEILKTRSILLIHATQPMPFISNSMTSSWLETVDDSTSRCLDCSFLSERMLMKCTNSGIKETAHERIIWFICIPARKEFIVVINSIEMNNGRNGPRVVLNPAHPTPAIVLSASCIAQQELESSGNEKLHSCWNFETLSWNGSLQRMCIPLNNDDAFWKINSMQEANIIDFHVSNEFSR